MTKQAIAKGFRTEELLRYYFLRAGFFVVRGVPLRVEGADLTDIDLWIYERSATLARRRTIIDVKDKQRPQAAERMFFVSGLAKTIGVEGCGVATTDRSPVLRQLARRNKILWIDGDDLLRMKKSDKLPFDERMAEEEFTLKVDDLDRQRGGRRYRTLLDDLKSTVGDRFGASSANRALDAFSIFSTEAIKSHPRSMSAEVFVRLALYSAAISAASIDFASADFALRPAPERRQHMASLIRYGENAESTFAKISWMESALREYMADGSAIARRIGEAFKRDAAAIPAEDLADIVLKLSNTDDLFDVSRTLEYSAFRREAVSFDDLPAKAKGFVGALVDFSRMDRQAFAAAMAPRGWQAADSENIKKNASEFNLIDRGDQEKLI